MLATRLQGYHPSLRRWTRAFIAVWLAGAALVTPVALTRLEQICEDARSTSRVELPSLLDRDRKAIKLERLSSFVANIGAAPDARVERHFLLQFQALAQGVDLDNDAGLDATVARAGAEVRRLLDARAALRRLGGPDAADDPAARAALEDAARAAAEAATGLLNAAADRLTTGSALTADALAERIGRNAAWIERGSLLLLAVLVASGLSTLWFFHRHVIAPIQAAVRGLAGARGPDGAPVALPRSLFSELDVIGRAVEQYARSAAELRAANLALHRLSSQDGLTGVGNRRGFDRALDAACREAAAGAGTRSLLLIDVDHFKALNDRFGHLAGDRCLKRVAAALLDVCAPENGLVSRYGGEEFAVLVPDLDRRGVRALADRLRDAVKRLPPVAGDGERCPGVTVSVGAVTIGAAVRCSPEGAIQSADEALYRAKAAGRDRVCLAPLRGAPAVGAQTAA